MRVSLVVAMARNRVIGRSAGLPWRIGADLRNFKRLTAGKPLIMGRKTHEAIGGPLPDRPNIVITREAEYPDEGIYVVADLAAAFKAAEAFTRITGVDEVMVIGGGEIYRQSLPFADRIYMTEIHAEPEGDATFPELDKSAWQEVERKDHDGREDDADHPYSFVVLQRRPD